MPTEIFSLTAMTLWPLALAVIVWLIASQSAKEADEIEKVVGGLIKSIGADSTTSNGHIGSESTTNTRRQFRPEV